MYIHVVQTTPRLLTKVNAYISRSKHRSGRLILNHKRLLEIMKKFHEQGFFPQKNLQFLTKVNQFLHVHIAKCNIEIDTYLSFFKN